MIELINVYKYYQTDIGRHYVLRDVSLEIPRDINVAIIGANGSGKSTTLRLIAGVDTPNSGKIIRTGRISWPMGLTPGVQQSLNGYENARFACRIYGMPNEEIRDTIEKVRGIADIGKYFDLSVNTYSAGMRQRLSFAISISLDFDYYLFDEIGAGGDRRFKKLAKELIDKRLSTSNFIMVSHAPADILELCQAAILLREGAAIYFDDVREALAEYGEAETIEKIDRRTKNKANRERKRAKRSSAGGAGAAAEDPSSQPDSSASPRRKRKARKKKLRAKRRVKRAQRQTGDSYLPEVKQLRNLTSAEAGSESFAETASAAPKKHRARKQAKQRLGRLKMRRLASAGDEVQASTSASSAAPASSHLPQATKPAKSRGKRKQWRNAKKVAAGTPDISRPAARRRRQISGEPVYVRPEVGTGKNSGEQDSKPHAAAANKIHALAESWSTRGKPHMQSGSAPRKRDYAE